MWNKDISSFNSFFFFYSGKADSSVPPHSVISRKKKGGGYTVTQIQQGTHKYVAVGSDKLCDSHGDTKRPQSC